MYTPAQAATVFRCIRQLLLNQPELFTKEGLFRLSGDHEKAKGMVNHILDPMALIKAPPLMNELSVYEAISALKMILDDKQSSILDQNNKHLVKLKESLENDNLSQCVQALNQFIHQLSTSSNKDEHFAGEVLYTFVQLAKETLRHQKMNRMTAENLGIVLGPNFEKLINHDPAKMLLLTNKLNVICRIMLESDTYTIDFEKKYTPFIIEARKQQIAEYQAMRKIVVTQKALYHDKLSEYKNKVAKEKSLLKKASRKDKVPLEAQIKHDESLVFTYQWITEEQTAIKVESIDAQISELERDLMVLNEKYPDQQQLQLRRIADLLEEIEEYITDSDDESRVEFNQLRPCLIKTKSQDNLVPMDMSDEDERCDILRRSRNPLMTSIYFKN